MGDGPGDGVVVVGGGLAGTAAALHLADAGWPVTLLERRERLGGRAFSFVRDGIDVDNGQHVFLRCCSAYRQFVTRLGMDDAVQLQPRLDIPVLRPGTRPARLFRTALAPAPMHLAQALARYGHLSATERLAAVRAALGLRLLDPDNPALDERTLGDYLTDVGQSPRSIDRLWGVIATATLNAPPAEASLGLAAMVFRTGLLERAAAADVGWARTPLGELHDTAARRALAAAGVEVLTGVRVRSVLGSTVTATVDRPRGRTATWRGMPIVLALPHQTAFAVAPDLLRTPAAPAAELGTSAIVNLHVVFDRRVTELEFAAAVDSPLHWLFDRTVASGVRRRRPGGQYLAATISAADALLREPNPRLVPRLLEALCDLLPAARRAEVVAAWTTREPTATFRAVPGSAAMRPGPRAGPPGTWLAGAWTATGWPDTMESAVRSGVAAAQAVLADTTRTEAAA